MRWLTVRNLLLNSIGRSQSVFESPSSGWEAAASNTFALAPTFSCGDCCLTTAPLTAGHQMIKTDSLMLCAVRCALYHVPLLHRKLSLAINLLYYLWCSLTSTSSCNSLYKACMCVFVVYHVPVLQSTTSAPLILSAYPSLWPVSIYLSTYLSISHQVIVSTVSDFKHHPSLSADTSVLH